MLLGLLLAVLGIASEIAHSPSVSSLSVTANSITLTVPIDIVGAQTLVLAEWQRSIDQAWNLGNDGQPFVFCGKRVIFDARFNPLPAVRTPKTTHLVIVRDVGAGEPFVSSVWHVLGTSPSYSPRTGYWGSNINGGTSAHEFGHLLGLLDEYVDTNAGELRQPGERPSPDVRRFPDAPFSLMATDRGVVLQRHIREVLRMHGIDAAAACADGSR